MLEFDCLSWLHNVSCCMTKFMLAIADTASIMAFLQSYDFPNLGWIIIRSFVRAITSTNVLARSEIRETNAQDCTLTNNEAVERLRYVVASVQKHAQAIPATEKIGKLDFDR